MIDVLEKVFEIGAMVFFTIIAIALWVVVIVLIVNDIWIGVCIAGFFAAWMTLMTLLFSLSVAREQEHQRRMNSLKNQWRS